MNYEMIKYIDVSGDDSFAYGEILQSHGLSNGFHKTATDLPLEIQKVMESIKPEKGSIFVVIAPMGMGEFWGPNVNGDFFPQAGLEHKGKDYGHETFLDANMFRHHINKDPKKGFGKIIVSAIDKPMKRVVVISKLSIKDMKNKGAGEFLRVLENGGLPEVSMGCKVPFDTCSVCGNKAKHPMFYCKHLKPDNMLKEDDETGKVAYAINDFPKFFDLSFVHRGADRSSGTLMKIASDHTYDSKRNFYMPSAYQALLEDSLQKEAEEQEESLLEEAVVEGMQKLASANDHPLFDHLKQNPDLLDRERNLEEYALTKMAKESWGQICGSFWSHGIPLKREEIQFVSLVKMGHSQLAKDLYRSNKLLPLVAGQTLPDEELSCGPESLKIASSYYKARTIRQPYFRMRCSRPGALKQAGEISNADAAMVAAGTTAAYHLISKLVKQTDIPVLAKLMKANPALLAALGFGSFAAAKVVGGAKPPAIERRDQVYSYSTYKGASAKGHIGKAVGDSAKDVAKNLKDAFKNIATDIIGDKADLAATALLTAGFGGYLRGAQKEKAKSEKFPHMGEIKGMEKFVADHPFLTTAAFMTAANLVSRKGLGALKPGKKTASENSVKIDMEFTFPSIERGNIEYENYFTLDLLKCV